MASQSVLLPCSRSLSARAILAPAMKLAGELVVVNIRTTVADLVVVIEGPHAFAAFDALDDRHDKSPPAPRPRQDED